MEKSEFVEFIELVEEKDEPENDGERKPDEALPESHSDNGDVDSPVKPGNDNKQSGNDNKQPGNDNLDLPPEFCHYRDEGCEMADSCLECPFSKCIYDEPGGKQRWLRKRRAHEIARLHIIEGKRVKELSEMFRISERTVQRDLKAAESK